MTLTVAAVAIAACGIIAVTCVELLSVVVICVPLNVTKACGLKLLPITCSGKAGPPAVAFGGLKLAIAGIALGVIDREP